MPNGRSIRWLKSKEVSDVIERTQGRVLLRYDLYGYDDKILDFLLRMINMHYDKNKDKVDRIDYKVTEELIRDNLEESVENILDEASEIAENKDKDIVEMVDVIESYSSQYCSVFPVC